MGGRDARPPNRSSRKLEMNEITATASAPLTNAIGLHARPSVKLTKLAKSFAARIEVAPTPDGPWVDAKSIVKVMAVKAPKGAVLHFRARGVDADAALAALGDLVALEFHEKEGGREQPDG
jgi:phosphocarrier protein